MCPYAASAYLAGSQAMASTKKTSQEQDLSAKRYLLSWKLVVCVVESSLLVTHVGDFVV